MKNKIIFLFMMMFILPLSVFANDIYNIDITIELQEDGSALVHEEWDVDGSDGTEWYKVLSNMGNIELSDFVVYMDGDELTYKTWVVSESLNEKKGYYGINNITNGMELCFGKYDYHSHVFTLTYKLSNFVFNTSDAQVIYYRFIDRLDNVDFDNFSVTISSYYEFPDTLDVWGYGYKGYAYVTDGNIYMSNEESMDSNYVVLLAKFPLNTFNTTNSYDMYDTFSDVYDNAEENTFDYDYSINEESSGNIFHGILNFIVRNMLFIFMFIYFLIRSLRGDRYGYINNKKIDKKNVQLFRDIPCNKDIYYANALIKLNNFDYKDTNIFGAIILKWVRENKVEFKNKDNGKFNKNTSYIDLTKKVEFTNEDEKKLFDIMYEASSDGLLEAKELEKWCKNNYSEFLDLFKKMNNNYINLLKEKNEIYKRKDRNECKYKYVMSDKIYQDSINLYGLKKFLIEFSNMKEKEVMEVYLWDEYLMFAYLFGIANKVYKQLKDLYPEVIEEVYGNNFSYDTLVFIDHISSKSVYAASSAREEAISYSSGGGGFSSGGGGGGSFGGGGFSSGGGSR